MVWVARGWRGGLLHCVRKDGVGFAMAGCRSQGHASVSARSAATWQPMAWVARGWRGGLLHCVRNDEIGFARTVRDSQWRGAVRKDTPSSLRGAERRGSLWLG